MRVRTNLYIGIAPLLVFHALQGLPSCWDVPTEVKVYSGTLDNYGDKPTHTKQFSDRYQAQKYSDDSMFDENGFPAFNVTTIDPLEECDGSEL